VIWVRRWERIIPFLAFEPEIRKGIAVELLNILVEATVPGSEERHDPVAKQRCQ